MRSVEHAAEIAGGYDELAVRVGVSADRVIAWSAGRDMPDTTSFLLVLDVILLETKRLSRTAEALEFAQYVVRKAQKSSKTA